MGVKIIGQRYGRLTVAAYAGQKHYRVSCDCGTVKRVYVSNLGKTKSCGCLRKELLAQGNHYIHGHARIGRRSPEYESWRAMQQRCLNPKHSAFSYYGGRGITVSDRWNPRKGGSFTIFMADLGSRPAGTSLDRVNPEGPYTPENTRWAPVAMQQSNKRQSRGR